MKPAKQLIVVIGLDDSHQKPHAARFDAAQEVAVRKAAALMGFHIGVPKTDEARAIAAKLPEGRLFASGKAAIPFVRADLYEKAVDTLAVEPMAMSVEEALAAVKNAAPAAKTDSVATAKAASTAPAKSAPNNSGKTESAGTSTKTPPVYPRSWDEIGVGSQVLVFEGGKNEPSWWPCVVVAVSKDGASLTVRWRDYPKLSHFAARRTAVGLLPPSA